MKSLLDLLEGLPKAVLVALSFLVLVIVVQADLNTGNNFSISIFYAVPVVILAWFAPRWVAIGFSGLASLAWLWVFMKQNAAPPDPLIPYWNTLMEFATFSLIGHLVRALRRERDAKAQEAIRDPLTGVLNRRGFMRRLGEERDRATRSALPLTLAYIDIDSFKELNDRYGHAAGDRVLTHTADLIRASIRHTDFLGRLGGDEFAVILPDTTLDEADRVLSKIRSHLAAAGTVPATPATVSIGAVTYLDEFPTAEDILQESDREMYRVKSSGKDGLRLRAFSSCALEPPES